ncbi:MAG: hypothetical protein E6559_05715, partial [Pantoea sp.]|nr:hypothetical protein [Pantoea sp.]
SGDVTKLLLGKCPRRDAGGLGVQSETAIQQRSQRGQAEKGKHAVFLVGHPVTKSQNFFALQYETVIAIKQFDSL